MFGFDCIFLFGGLARVLVVTVVEGQVPLGKAKEFEDSFALAKKESLPPGFVSSSLLRRDKLPETYRIQTTWESQEALERMKSSIQTPKAFEFFLKVGVKPNLEVYEALDNIP
jgi:heme-degrading monooxygenase HmoA